MQTGSTYEWDVASNISTDVINVTTGASNNGNLILGNMTIKINDAGVTTAIANTDQLTVFTYETGAQAVVRSIGTVTLDTSSLGAGWSGTPSLVDNGTGTIYVTGLTFTPGGGTAYDTWATGSEPFGGDANGDGVKDGLAFLLGAANPTENAIGRLPTVTESGGGLVLEFDCLNTAGRGTAVLNLQFSNDLGVSDPWTTVEVPGVAGTTDVGSVHFVATGTSPIHVVATISSSEAAAGKLFGRLEANQP